jgi:hypothetical protein
MLFLGYSSEKERYVFREENERIYMQLVAYAQLRKVKKKAMLEITMTLQSHLFELSLKGKRWRYYTVWNWVFR